MKVKSDGYSAIWDDKLRNVMFFTHKSQIQLFSTPVTGTNKVNSIAIKESGNISPSSWYINYTGIKFVYCVNDKSDECKIIVAVEDK
jgi:hypothetical protein